MTLTRESLFVYAAGSSGLQRSQSSDFAHHESSRAIPSKQRFTFSFNRRRTTSFTMIRRISLLFMLLGVCSSAVDLSRELDIWNDSGNKVQVYWLHPGTGEAVRYADVKSGSKAVINSFVNHTFMLRDGNETDTCVDENCHVNYVTVTEDHKRQRKLSQLSCSL